MTLRLVDIFILLVLFSFFPSTQASGMSGSLMSFFDKMGIAGNVTAPGSFKDQTGGYYTGGSLSTRVPAKTIQPATLQAPGYRAGCGGIDAWTGGFSHISGQQLVELLRDIGSKAGAYAFQLAIQTISPQIYNTMNELNALMTSINNLNINSCETAATLLGGVWPKSDQTSQHLCKSMGSNLGAFSDWSAARQGCGAKGDRAKILSGKDSDPRYKDMLVGEFNLAWKAIQANAFLSSDQELAELFLTLVGSIISKQVKDDQFQLRFLPGQGDRDDLISGLMNGGEVPIYKCNDEKCLNPVLKSTNLSPSKSLLEKTRTILDSIETKIYADEAATKAEIDFLNSTRLPIWKMFNVLSAYRRGEAPVDIQSYSELIATDILYKYVLECIDIVYDATAQLKSVQVDDTHIEKFLKSLQTARTRINQKRTNAFADMDQTLKLIESTQILEKQLHVTMGTIEEF